MTTESTESFEADFMESFESFMNPTLSFFQREPEPEKTNRELMLGFLDNIVISNELIDPTLLDTVILKRDNTGGLWAHELLIANVCLPQNPDEVLTEMFEKQKMEEERSLLSPFNPESKARYDELTDKINSNSYGIEAKHTPIKDLPDAVLKLIIDHIEENWNVIFKELEEAKQRCRDSGMGEHPHYGDYDYVFSEEFVFDVVAHTTDGKRVRAADVGTDVEHTYGNGIDYLTFPYFDLYEPSDEDKDIPNIRVTIDLSGFYETWLDDDRMHPGEWRTWEEIEFRPVWSEASSNLGAGIESQDAKYEDWSIKVEDINQEHFKGEDFYVPEPEEDEDEDKEDWYDEYYSGSVTYTDVEPDTNPFM